MATVQKWQKINYLLVSDISDMWINTKILIPQIPKLYALKLILQSKYRYFDTSVISDNECPEVGSNYNYSFTLT